MLPPFLGPLNPLGYPAPYWFLLFFKVFGFTLHMTLMNLWFAGLVTMLVLRWRGGAHAQRLSDRVINAMPFVVAFGINLGIVPLLFTQVAYYQVFYPATILSAWPWFAVIPLLMVAYYGVYLYVIGLRKGRLTPLMRAAGWLSAALFMLLGLAFSNTFSLMTNVAGWGPLWNATSQTGAPLGIGINLSDPTLLPRLLMMFGLALTTTAAYIAVDTGFFAGGESPEYKRWAMRFALILSTVGNIWVAGMGSWYFFGALSAEVRAAQLTSPMIVLTLLTAADTGVPWLLMLFAQRGLNTWLALRIGLAQLGALGLHAVSRQIVQNLELAPYLKVGAEPVNMQLSPLLLFLVLFVGGLGVVVWMVVQVVRAVRQPAIP
jgi:hypothetical protein